MGPRPVRPSATERECFAEKVEDSSGACPRMRCAVEYAYTVLSRLKAYILLPSPPCVNEVIPKCRCLECDSGCCVVDKAMGLVRRLYRFRMSQSFSVVLDSEPVSNKCDRPGEARNDIDVTDMAPTRDICVGAVSLRPESRAKVPFSLTACVSECAPSIVLYVTASQALYWVLSSFAGVKPEGRLVSATYTSEPLHRISQIRTLPSRLDVAMTLSLSGWKQTCLTEVVCSCIRYLIFCVFMSMI